MLDDEPTSRDDHALNAVVTLPSRTASHHDRLPSHRTGSQPLPLSSKPVLRRNQTSHAMQSGVRSLSRPASFRRSPLKCLTSSPPNVAELIPSFLGSLPKQRSVGQLFTPPESSVSALARFQLERSRHRLSATSDEEEEEDEEEEGEREVIVEIVDPVSASRPFQTPSPTKSIHSTSSLPPPTSSTKLLFAPHMNDSPSSSYDSRRTHDDDVDASSSLSTYLPSAVNSTRGRHRSLEDFVPDWISWFLLELVNTEKKSTFFILQIFSPFCFFLMCLQIIILGIDFRAIFGHMGNENYIQNDEISKNVFKWIFGLFIDPTVFYRFQSFSPNFLTLIYFLTFFCFLFFLFFFFLIAKRKTFLKTSKKVKCFTLVFIRCLLSFGWILIVAPLLRRILSWRIDKGMVLIGGFGVVSDELWGEPSQLPATIITAVLGLFFALAVISLSFVFSWRIVGVRNDVIQFLSLKKKKKKTDHQKKKKEKKCSVFSSSSSVLFGSALTGRWIALLQIGILIQLICKIFILTIPIVNPILSSVVLIIIYCLILYNMPFIHLLASFLIGLSLSLCLGGQLTTIAVISSSLSFDGYKVYLLIGLMLICGFVHCCLFVFRFLLALYSSPKHLQKSSSMWSLLRIVMKWKKSDNSYHYHHHHHQRDLTMRLFALFDFVIDQNKNKDLNDDNTKSLTFINGLRHDWRDLNNYIRSTGPHRLPPDLAVFYHLIQFLSSTPNLDSFESRQIRDVQEDERKLGVVLRMIFCLLLQDNFSPIQMSGLFSSFEEKHEQCRRKYVALHLHFPDSKLVHMTYAKFLRKMCFDSDGAEAILSHIENGPTAVSNEKKRADQTRDAIASKIRQSGSFLSRLMVGGLLLWLIGIFVAVVAVLVSTFLVAQDGVSTVQIIASASSVHRSFSLAYFHDRRLHLTEGGLVDDNTTNATIELASLVSTCAGMKEDLDELFEQLPSGVVDSFNRIVLYDPLNISVSLSGAIELVLAECVSHLRGHEEEEEEEEDGSNSTISIPFLTLRTLLSVALDDVLDSLNARRGVAFLPLTISLFSLSIVPPLLILLLLLIHSCFECSSLRILTMLPKDEVVVAARQYGLENDTADDDKLQSRRATPLLCTFGGILLCVVLIAVGGALLLYWGMLSEVSAAYEYSKLDSQLERLREADLAAMVLVTDLAFPASEIPVSTARSELRLVAQSLRTTLEVVRSGGTGFAGLDANAEFYETFYECGDDDDGEVSDDRRLIHDDDDEEEDEEEVCSSMYAAFLRRLSIYQSVAEEDELEERRELYDTLFDSSFSVVGMDYFVRIESRVSGEYVDHIWPYFYILVCGALVSFLALFSIVAMLPFPRKLSRVISWTKALFLFLSTSQSGNAFYLTHLAQKGSLSGSSAIRAGLSERQSRLFQLFDTSTSLGFLTFSRRLTLLYINPTAMRLFQIATLELAYLTSVGDLFDDSDELVEWVRSRIKKSRTFSISTMTRSVGRRHSDYHQSSQEDMNEFDCNHQPSRRRQEVFPVSVTVLRKGDSFLAVVRCLKEETMLRKVVDNERQRSEALLLNLLPSSIVSDFRLSVDSSFFSAYDSASMVFLDIVDFTKLSTTLEPETLVQALHSFFCGLDEIVVATSCEKVKTIGDAYFCVSGVPDPQANHPECALHFAKDSLSFLGHFNDGSFVQFEVRIGIHTGKVVAGVIGHVKFTWDLFGDSVNMASRMCSTGLVNRIQVSHETYLHLGSVAKFEARKLHVKGKGMVTAFLLAEDSGVMEVEEVFL